MNFDDFLPGSLQEPLGPSAHRFCTPFKVDLFTKGISMNFDDFLPECLQDMFYLSFPIFNYVVPGILQIRKNRIWFLKQSLAP